MGPPCHPRAFNDRCPVCSLHRDDPAYRALWGERGGNAPAKPPRVCIHLGPPLVWQTLTGEWVRQDCGCSHRLRWCDIFGTCSTGPSPAEHWCRWKGGRCPEFETSETATR